MRDHKPLTWGLFGAAILAGYGVVAALQPISAFGLVYAAYGGIFIALSLLWGIVVDGFRPDRGGPAGRSAVRVGRSGHGHSVEGVAPSSSADAHLRVEEPLGLPSPLMRSHTSPPADPTSTANSKNGQHSRSLATNSATASKSALSGECGGGFTKGGWLPPFADNPLFGEVMGDRFAKVGGFVLGRKTYEIFAAWWPNIGDEDPTAAKLNHLPKYRPTGRTRRSSMVMWLRP